MAHAKTLLLLGGSAQQLVAIDAAKRCGYRTVVCDYLPDNPGQHHADAFYLTSTTDREAVLEVARAENVGGVVAYSSDPAAPTAAYVAEKLGLPTNPLASVEILSVKTKFRDYLSKAGFPCPRFAGIPAQATLPQAQALIEPLRLPVVVKPSDSSGSKGVSVLESLDDLEEALDKARPFTRNGMLIAEEFIERATPHIVGGDIFVKDGRICFWGLSNCYRDEVQPVNPRGESIPLELSDSARRKVQAALQDLVTSLDIRFGELNVEVIVGKGEVPYILELGARAGGGMIPVQFSDLSGIDLVRANVMCAMGDDPGDLEWQPHDECCASYLMNSDKSGIYRGFTLSPVAKKACSRIFEFKERGSHIERYEHSGHMLGVLLFRFDDRNEMNAMLDAITEHVIVDVE